MEPKWAVWSGQGPDEPAWYASYRFWRRTVLAVLMVIGGCVYVANQSAQVPFSGAHVDGWKGVAIGVLLIVAGVALFVFQIKDARENG